MHIHKKPKLVTGAVLDIQTKYNQAINAREGVEKREPSYIVAGNAN